MRLPERILTLILNKGYPRVTMRRKGQSFYRFAHQMVAEAFLGPRPDGQEVRHKNGDRSNPSLFNIEYGTRAQNIADCKIHGTFRNGAAHLTEEIVRQITARPEQTAASLATEFNVSVHTIINIRLGRTWAHLGLPLRGQYVRQIAERQGWADAALAKELGVSVSTMANIRRGRIRARFNLLLRKSYVGGGDERRAKRGMQGVADPKP
jgi:hypothetical protein